MVLPAGVNRDNLEICLHRYKCHKCKRLVEDDDNDTFTEVGTSATLWGIPFVSHH